MSYEQLSARLLTTENNVVYIPYLFRQFGLLIIYTRSKNSCGRIQCLQFKITSTLGIELFQEPPPRLKIMFIF